MSEHWFEIWEMAHYEDRSEWEFSGQVFFSYWDAYQQAEARGEEYKIVRATRDTTVVECLK